MLFGGESAEHDVSCTTAAHVLRAADPARYRITPIGISTDGRWALATEAQAALAYKEAKNGFTIPGFGKLVVRSYTSRMGRNPQTG